MDKANELTNVTFWTNYWLDKKAFISDVEKQAVEEILGPFQAVFPKQPGSAFLELGGFPGKFTAYFKQKYGYEVTILDYYLEETVVRQVEQDYSFACESIHTVKADLFTLQPTQEFDIVTSFGLIEHFYNTREILEKHLGMLKTGGLLFMTVPNFLGINGWAQRTFDPENLAKHNLKVMDPDYLQAQCASLPIRNLHIVRSGKGGLWLEPHIKLVGMDWLWYKLAGKAAKYLNKVLPNSKLTAPWVVIYGTKL